MRTCIHSLALLTWLVVACTQAPTTAPTTHPDIALPASSVATVAPTRTVLPSPTSVPPTLSPVPLTSTAAPTASTAPTATTTATATATATRLPPTPTLTVTPDPFAGLTIMDLAARDYGGGELHVEQVLAVTAAFTRTLVSYPSDGLTVYGFLNVPPGAGPFPVVLVLHGYINPAVYSTLAYTTRYADALARAGYLVIHPNYRSYPPSDDGPNPFRVGYAVDVLNLIALVQEQGGQPGALSKADPHSIGLWGHSMGGGITLRTITVEPEIDAAVVYGSMSGDEKANFERILAWSGGQQGEDELSTPEEDLQRISPIYHLERITAAVSVHHGEADGTVPLEWSQDLCARLDELGKTVECFTYPGQPHTFQGEGDELLIQRVTLFFDQHLRQP